VLYLNRLISAASRLPPRRFAAEMCRSSTGNFFGGRLQKFEPCWSPGVGDLADPENWPGSKDVISRNPLVPNFGGAEPIFLVLNHLSGASTVSFLLNQASSLWKAISQREPGTTALAEPMELRQLQVLIAVAEEGRLQKAAERLHRTIPAVSVAIGKLEEEVGRPLFERSKNTA
jgi:hypothetical protein